MPKDLTIYEYKITFSPNKSPLPGARSEDKLKSEDTARIIALLEETPTFQPFLSHIAHDKSEKLVSSELLPQPLEVPVSHRYEGEPTARQNAPVYTVKIAFVKELNSTELTQHMSGQPQYRDADVLPIVSALNLVLQQHASRVGVRVGKNRYFIPTSNAIFPLTLGLEARQGFFLSVRPMYKQLMVNINVCTTAFYLPGNLAMAMMAFQRESSGGMPRDFADKLKVVTTYLGYPRKRTIKSIARTPASRTTFHCEEFGGNISVEEYYKRKYNIKLQHADDLPLIDVSGFGRPPSYLPAELCEIPPNQAFHGLLSDKATAEMIKIACNIPAYNADAIVNQGFPQLGLDPNAPAGPLQGFGISVSNDMTVVPARILDAPRVAYKSGQPNVRDASWNILDVKFQRGGNMTNWAVLLVQQGYREEFAGPTDPRLLTFLKTFSNKCQASGMTVPNGPPKIMATPPLPPATKDPGRNQALETIRKTLTGNLDRNRKPSFILVLLSNVDKFIYPGIKHLCDVVMGLATVHMLLKKAAGDERKQDQYFSNVALKVNIKLGGINHLLDPQSMKWMSSVSTMLVGIDVTHPSPTSIKGTPSIAAVVASVDKDFVQFPASLRPQRNKNINKNAEEMVQDLTEMMIERLLLFQKRNNNALPQRIIVFRDGVSEGQYDLVLRHELPRLLDAFKKLKGGQYRPKLSIVICGKRHHARNYATGQDHVSRNGNTLPGTIVDKGITDIYGFDFYLQAHNGLQGQARPTHYYIVYDENRMDADSIQETTHRTSYLYARATKGVSLVPPAYYADLACERARLYLNKFLNLGDDSKSVASSEKGKGKGKKTDAEIEQEREAVYQKALKVWSGGVQADLSESMFYI
ncbi:unnamed protein product [Somion occarium]|uniref:Piwi-domain-containing protein n=1 Tax=Somion occarium TaxID=3059160 RepID=A0ABP1D3W5_9APHY